MKGTTIVVIGRPDGDDRPKSPEDSSLGSVDLREILKNASGRYSLAEASGDDGKYEVKKIDTVEEIKEINLPLAQIVLLLHDGGRQTELADSLEEAFQLSKLFKVRTSVAVL
jgi:hypothetical protein